MVRGSVSSVWHTSPKRHFAATSGLFHLSQGPKTNYLRRKDQYSRLNLWNGQHSLQSKSHSAGLRWTGLKDERKKQPTSATLFWELFNNSVRKNFPKFWVLVVCVCECLCAYSLGKKCNLLLMLCYFKMGNKLISVQKLYLFVYSFISANFHIVP